MTKYKGFYEYFGLEVEADSEKKAQQKMMRIIKKEIEYDDITITSC